jgi:hypothetical protein
MGILPVQENNRTIEIDGKKIKKVLNVDQETIKVLRLMEKNTKNIVCEKIVLKVE